MALPVSPNYMPSGDIERMDWGINFDTKIIDIGPLYNIPAAMITAVTASTLRIKEFKANFVFARDFAKALVKNKNDLFTLNTSTTGPPVGITDLPKFVAWTSLSWPPGLLQPHIEVAMLLLANTKLTATDKTALLLDKLTPKAASRPTAKKVQYPLMTSTNSATGIELKIARSTKNRGLVCNLLYSMDMGKTFQLFSSNSQSEQTFPVTVPEGQLAVLVIFKAIFMKNNVEYLEWSPNLMVSYDHLSPPTTPTPPPPPTEPTPPTPPPPTPPTP